MIAPRSTNERSRVPPVAALAAGVLLWFVPTFGQPAVGSIVAALRALGLLDPAGDDYAAAFVATLLLRWLAAALLLVFVLTVERQPLSSVGIGPVRWKDVHRTVLVAGLAMTVSFALYLIVQGGQSDESTQTSRILSSLSFAQLVHLIINAAVVEELFFRGFLIERISTATGRPWLGALVSYVVFVGCREWQRA